MAVKKNEEYDELISNIKHQGLLKSVIELLNWDQEVMMPKGYSNFRASEKSYLSEIQHDILATKRNGILLKNLEKAKLSAEQKANVNEIKFEYERATKVPTKLISNFAELTVTATEIWRKARKENNYKSFAPELKKIIDFNKKYAKLIDPNQKPYQVIFDEYERGISIDEVSKIFTEIKTEIVPLIKQIKSKKIPKIKILDKDISIERQKKLCKELAKELGYDFNKGRLDISTHPFTGSYGRITTRYDEGWLSSILSVIHECGHGMYEHNLPEEHFGTPLGQSRSYSIHESQSRFWENHIGRKKEFWKKLIIKLRKYYGIHTTINHIYSAINAIKPCYIRVNADELTYPLHIILRFEIEQELINGKLSVDELPNVWNHKMKEYIGLTPPTDTLGVLQDIHWPSGGLGYFATYTLGTIIAAQLYYAMEAKISDLNKKIEAHDFKEIQDFLKENIQSKGKLYTTKELIKRATGEELSSVYYTNYLKNKFSKLYGL